MQIDLRSDTFTLPTPNMLDAMRHAEVGDDVFGEDPSVNKLEEKVAKMFEKEAALFFPSGTMANQVAIKCHTSPGDEVICEAGSHIYIYEGGGIAFNSGCQVRPLTGNWGRITAEQVEEAINPDDIHRPPSRLVSLENTANRGGGSIYPFEDMLAIKEVCQKYQLSLHLDGARIWNAMVATGATPESFGSVFDSLSVCLSKGLGAPVGSVLAGSSGFIQQARRFRKVMGGGMRQAGYLAAAGIYALDHQLHRLKDDHHHAQTIAAALANCRFVEEVLPVDTNIIIFNLNNDRTPAQFCQMLAEQQVYCLPVSSKSVRMVTHLNVTSAMVDRLVQLLKKM